MKRRPASANASNDAAPSRHGKDHEPWHKVTVIMRLRHAAYLDRLCIDIRMKHRKALYRSDIIRALIDFMDVSGIDFAECTSETEIVERLIEYFGSTGRRPASRRNPTR